MLAGQFLAVGAGAALGGWSRWGLGLVLNNSVLPLGTLLANLLGGFLMGLALALFIAASAQNELRLFIMTGFLGGLTTFSTFSAEAFNLLHKQEYAWASLHIASHVLGSLLMTAFGFWIVYYLRN